MVTRRLLFLLSFSSYIVISQAFVTQQQRLSSFRSLATSFASETNDSSVTTITDATNLLAEYDRNPSDSTTSKSDLATAVVCLNLQASRERQKDSTKGRVMLGICANDSTQGLATLKAWVNALELPRGLLHGMDVNGEPLEIQNGVYIKYNTGGSLTFAEMRNSGMGWDALWRPGDALLEEYDGEYRGVYYQVELADQEFRQYLVPLDTFQ